MTTTRDEGGSEVVRLPQRTPFTMVDNPIIRAMTDYVALGLYLDMLSYPAGWRINIRELARSHKQGRQVLTDAMNDLIDKGLVFRVRFQEAGGQWRTRTYVCSSPVTFPELQEVQNQYLERCLIETNAQLSALLHPTQLSTGRSGQDGSDDSLLDTEAEEPAKPLVTPSTRFPAPGEPASGRPTVGDLVPKRSEGRSKKPPPPPAPVASKRRGAAAAEEDVLLTTRAALPSLQTTRPTEPDPAARAGPDVEQLSAALAKAWPRLGRRDLQQLQPMIQRALNQLSPPDLTAHLTSNTGGALHPLGLLRARLDNLPPPRSSHRRQAWCGRCTSESYRWLQDDDGQPLSPCPRCSPQAHQPKTASAPEAGKSGCY